MADKKNRSLGMIKKYVEKCMEEIAAYVDEKNMAVKNFGIDLEIEKKAAYELMKKIQRLTEEELAKKSESIAWIEEHTRTFESSLEELFGMTGRVQENMNRIRDESDFVQKAGKRVTEAKEKYEQLEKALEKTARNLEETEERFERKNAEALDQAVRYALESAKSKVSDFEATALSIENKIEEHRDAIVKVERDRKANLAHDVEQVKTILKDALENAGKRADKIEESAFAKLREQALERVEQIKTFFEDKMKNARDILKNEQEKLNTEIHDINVKQKNHHQEWTKEAAKIDTTIKSQMDSWKQLGKETELGIITANEKRLEEYGKTHAESVKQLSGLADEAGQLENELRLSMQEVISRVNKDFSGFEKESAASMETAASAFNAQAQALRKELEDMDNELNSIRQQASDNVSEKLLSFENDITTELGKRSSELGRNIADWQASLEERLASSRDKIANDWQSSEEQFAFEQRKNIANLGERLTADFEVLKRETSVFEESIREEMKNFDEMRSSFAGQIKQDLAEMRVSSENELNIQIGQYQLSMQETLRLKQRELEEELEEISARSQNTYDSLDNALQNSRQGFEEWQNQYNIRIRETDVSLEDLRRHSREMAAENDERISQLRLNLDDIRKEQSAQRKMFDQTNILKKDLEKSIEEINSDLNRLEQRKKEITQLEADLTRVKRLEDEVNNKMTRFLAEQRRIEQMEANFNNLIKTSQSVKDKLDQISTSDDILQNVQVHIRKLDDSIKETEDKYQRIERKNEVLNQTNEGIERNFKTLQKTETDIKNTENIITTLSDQFDNLRSSIETLAAQSEKAIYAEEKITVLDDTLAKIEQRIAKMNDAREWLARTETQLETLYKEVRAHLKLSKALFERESGKTTSSQTKGAPPPQDRDNIKRLKDQGWTIEEIAKAMNLSRGEVELTLELYSRS